MANNFSPITKITGIIAPLFLLVLVLGILGSEWDDFEYSSFTWLIYLLGIFLIEVYLFSRSSFKKIKNMFIKVGKRLLKISLYILPPLLIIIIVGIYFNNQKIPLDKVSVELKEYKNLFLSSYRVDDIKIKLVNDSEYQLKNIKILVEIYYKEDSIKVFETTDMVYSIDYNDFEYKELYIRYKRKDLKNVPNKEYMFRELKELKEELPEYIKYIKKYSSEDDFNYLKGLYGITLAGHPVSDLDELFQMDRIDLHKIYKSSYSSNEKWKYIEQIIEKILWDEDFYINVSIISAKKRTFIDDIIQLYI
ncbi:MAG: hypothetical protein ISS29_00265 [Candidatus Marinimicrobia bacterium]|nr:hypothetical protein [Candidatus Neomarinimicrobiota bacterium]